MREKGQTEVAKTLETPVFSRGIEILTEKTELHRTTMTIGGAVYQITRHYRDSGAAAVTDKLIRLMEKELRSAH